MWPQVVHTQSPLVSLAVTGAENTPGDVWVYAATEDKALRRFRVTAASAEQRRATSSYLLAEVDKPRELPSTPTSLAISGDGAALLVTTVDGCVSGYSLPLMAMARRWALHDPLAGGASRAAVSYHRGLGCLVAVTGGGDAALHVLQLSRDPPIAPRDGPGGGTGPGGGPVIPSGHWAPGGGRETYPELFTLASRAAAFSEAFKEEQA